MVSKLPARIWQGPLASRLHGDLALSSDVVGVGSTQPLHCEADRKPTHGRCGGPAASPSASLGRSLLQHVPFPSIESRVRERDKRTFANVCSWEDSTVSFGREAVDSHVCLKGRCTLNSAIGRHQAWQLDPTHPENWRPTKAKRPRHLVAGSLRCRVGQAANGRSSRSVAAWHARNLNQTRLRSLRSLYCHQSYQSHQSHQSLVLHFRGCPASYRRAPGRAKPR